MPTAEQVTRRLAASLAATVPGGAGGKAVEQRTAIRLYPATVAAVHAGTPGLVDLDEDGTNVSLRAETLAVVAANDHVWVLQQGSYRVVLGKVQTL